METSNGKREFVTDALKQLHFEYNEVTTIYQKTTFAINATIFAISSAAVGYIVKEDICTAKAIPFYIAIIITLAIMIYSKRIGNERRHLLDSMINELYAAFLNSPNAWMKMNEEKMQREMGEIFKLKTENNKKIDTASKLIKFGNIASPLAFIIGLTLLVFF
jgi:hypothetical protein